MVDSLFLIDCALSKENARDLSGWFLPMLTSMMTLTRLFWFAVHGLMMSRCIFLLFPPLLLLLHRPKLLDVPAYCW